MNTLNMTISMRDLNLMILLSFIAASCGNGIGNDRTVDVMINGNCGMCEETIEAAGLQAGLSEVDWDRKTRHATVVFDSTRTTADAVLRRVANAGYDNEAYTATDEAYSARPQCCQYRRTGTHITPPAKGENGHGH